MNKEEEITDEILIVPVRELSYEDAKKEIIEYLEYSGKRNVYVSEVVQKLRLDIELTADIMRQWKTKNIEIFVQKTVFIDSPVIDCRFNNYLDRN